jgi:lactate dehydrogenase-like 2-hydroxyacid dehydrogenase
LRRGRADRALELEALLACFFVESNTQADLEPRNRILWTAAEYNGHMSMRFLAWRPTASRFATTSRSTLKSPTVLFCGQDFKHWIESIRALQPNWDCIAVPRAEVPAVLAQRPVDVAVPLMTRLSRDAIAAGKRNGLKLIQQFGAGLEGVDREAAAELGIPVMNIATREGNAVSTAEHAIYLLLSLLRRPHEMDAVLQSRGLGSPVGSTIHGKGILIIGFGELGKQAATRLRAFAPAEICAFRHGAWPESDLALVDDAGSFTCATSYSASTGMQRLLEMAQKSHVCIMCCPLNQHTQGILGEGVLAAMPRGSLVVNVARGGVIDRHALVSHLQSGHLSGAAMDVFWKEPFDRADADQGGVATMRALQAQGHNIVMTPHVGGVTELSRDKMSTVFVRNVQAVLDAAEA